MPSSDDILENMRAFARRLGLSPEGYSIVFEIHLKEGYHATDLEEPLGIDILGYKAMLQKHGENAVVLRITGIPSEDEARDLAQKIEGSILWNVIQDVALAQIKFKSEIVPGSTPTFHLNANLSVQTRRLITLCESFDTLVQQKHVHNICHNPKLRIAFDYYRLTRFDESPQARFLLLTTILEILAPDEANHPKVVELVQKWINEANQLRSEVNETESPGLKESYESLVSSIRWNLIKSIGRKIKDYIYKTLKTVHGEDEALRLSVQAKRLYGKRSAITHGRLYEGFEKDLEELENLVRMVLKASVGFTD